MFIFIARFFSVILLWTFVKNDTFSDAASNTYGVKVYRPTGPQSLSLECNEYGYVRFRIIHPEVLASAEYFDLDFMESGKHDNSLQKIIEKAPVQSAGYVAFFPWNDANLSSVKDYVIGMQFFDGNEQELEFRGISKDAGGAAFRNVYSIPFKLPQCAGITDVVAE